jgi:hypothetical protein
MYYFVLYWRLNEAPWFRPSSQNVVWSTHGPHPLLFLWLEGVELQGLASRRSSRALELANGLRLSTSVLSQDLSRASVTIRGWEKARSSASHRTRQGLMPPCPGQIQTRWFQASFLGNPWRENPDCLMSAHMEGREGNLSVRTQIWSLRMSGPLDGHWMCQLLATLCVASSLALVALGSSDPTGGLHLRTVSFGRPHGNRGTHFGYGCHIPWCRGRIIQGFGWRVSLFLLHLFIMPVVPCCDTPGVTIETIVLNSVSLCTVEA